MALRRKTRFDSPISYHWFFYFVFILLLTPVTFLIELDVHYLSFTIHIEY